MIVRPEYFGIFSMLVSFIFFTVAGGKDSVSAHCHRGGVFTFTTYLDAKP